MIPLSFFLIVWIVLLGIFAILVLLTLIQMLRHGVKTPGTYVSTFLFLGVVGLVLFGMSAYILTVDWSASVSLLPDAEDVFLRAL